eukprot:GAFH01000729.1.p1 GENE.GAFH01000729.1~~GAFH01000729.1.p1  ORF type:complete len:1218 (+),score=601.49 GAFH01000729.1:429-3656(+)
MACRASGIAMLCSASVQETMDLAAVAHLTTIQAQTPFMHFFDGFRTSHEENKIETIAYEDLKAMYDFEALREWREKRIMRNDQPTMRGLVDDANIYFQLLEATNPIANRIPELVQANMDKVARVTGRPHRLFDYYGAPDATDVVVVMGSASSVVAEYVNYRTTQGDKIGVVSIHLFRPFSASHLMAAIPATCTRLAVLDHVKEQGSVGEPLYLDVLAALSQNGRLAHMTVASGRFGLGGKDFTPVQAEAVYRNLKAGHDMKMRFTVGINDDVTGLSLPMGSVNPVPAPAGLVQSMFYGFGADGTVGSCKNTIAIIADETELYSQGFFAYDAKKSGGVTISHLRFGPQPITSSYEIVEADYVACHHPSYIHKYDMLNQIKDGGVFVVNCPFTTVEALERELPGSMKRKIAQKHLRFYAIDADAIATAAGLRGRINNVMQAVFFKLSNVLPIERALALLKGAITKTYKKKGDDVVQKNFACVDQTLEALRQIEVPAGWAQAPLETPVFAPGATEYFKTLAHPCLSLVGNTLPVSALVPHVGGALPTATGRFEKRGVAPQVPQWDPTACIACTFCSMVCPHAAIRPFLMTPEEKAHAPNQAQFPTIPYKPKPGMEFRIQISPMDCMGCEACVHTCPKKALRMADTHQRIAEDRDNWIYCVDTLPDRSNEIFDPTDPAQTATVANVQFRQPMLEFSAACAGCAETPVNKLLTQLYGERLVVANACGCSMVWGGFAPTCAYTTDRTGHGPVYTGSLFEDDAELAYGIAAGGHHRRMLMAKAAQDVLQVPELNADLRAAVTEWLQGYDDARASKMAGEKLVRLLAPASARSLPQLQELWVGRDLLQPKSYWAVGGDGWAYDIDFGGLDQVLSMGHKLNVLVLDTEVYSNTGGQKSKATPRGAVARFAAGGKDGKKKDLGMYAMSLGTVYVASCCLGANMPQLLKALVEADRYPGTSLVICYCPCINHGLKQGQGHVAQEQKLAVQTGYWPLYRFNPLLKKEGKNPLALDSGAATVPLSELLKSEVRFASLIAAKPEVARVYHQLLQEDIDERFANLQRMAGVAPTPRPAAPATAAPATAAH